MTTTASAREPAATSPAPARKRAGARFFRPEARNGLLLVLPCFLLFVLFRFGPAIAGGILSFTDYTLGGETEWTGLANFERLVHDDRFWDSLRVTVVYSLLAVPGSIIVSVAMAMLVRRTFRGVRLFRSIFFLPVVTSLVLAGIIFTWIFSEDGPWSSLLRSVGFEGGSWLADSVLVLPALVVVSIWTRFGYGMLIVLARLQDIPRELEEAAHVDGAGPWQTFRHIILPQLKPALFFLGVLETTVAFQAFDTIWVMTGGGPGRASRTLVIELYDQGFRNFDQDYAATIGVALFVMTLVVALIQRLIMGRDK
ncbi:sugar ABC transporter permease [Hamadaea sp. NPDC051192]|uniref:carbohydrate ABC transporter permease n=1 Tax=Hamadaea sp. NPDC051192 TaxID=3154940 RepID=UPI00341DB0E8